MNEPAGVREGVHSARWGKNPTGVYWKHGFTFAETWVHFAETWVHFAEILVHFGETWVFASERF